jgi:hypothetical protein
MGLREAVEALSNGDGVASQEEVDKLREAFLTEKWNNQQLQENMGLLELAMEEEGWRRFGARMRVELSRPGRLRAIEASRGMYMSNPLIKRAINVKTYYTWGQGVNTIAADETVQSEVIAPMMADEGNKAEWYSHQARLLTHVDRQIEGNLFMSLPTNMLGEVSLRSIPTEEIIDIHAKPGDRQQIWFYRRVWTEEEFDMATGEVNQVQYDELYPDYRYHPAAKPAKIGRYKVNWNAPIIHVRTGGTKLMKFGFPETYAALDWARAYKRFLEDWHTIVKSLAKFAWKRSTTGEKIAEEKAKFDSLNQTGSELEEPTDDELRRGQAGAVFLDTAEGDMSPIKTSGATTRADDAKASRLMVAGAMDLPDTILSGDVDVGNFATSKTLDRPTELGMVNEQLLWEDFDKAIYKYSIEAKIRKGLLPGRVEYQGFAQSKVISELDTEVEVSFPPVLEHDIGEMVKAIVTAATLDGKSDAGTIPRERLSRALGNALQFEQVEKMIGELTDEQKSELDQIVAQVNQKRDELAQAAKAPPGGQPPPGGDQPPEKPK